MKVRLTKNCDGPDGKRPAGTTISHPDAYRLVQLGVAEAVDDEARVAVRNKPAKTGGPAGVVEPVVELPGEQAVAPLASAVEDAVSIAKPRKPRREEVEGDV